MLIEYTELFNITIKKTAKTVILSHCVLQGFSPSSSKNLIPVSAIFKPRLCRLGLCLYKRCALTRPGSLQSTQQHGQGCHIVIIVSSSDSFSLDCVSSRLGWAGSVRPPEVPESRSGHGAGLSLHCQQRPLQPRYSGEAISGHVISVITTMQGAVAAALAGRSGGSVSRVVSSPQQVTRVTYTAPQTVSYSPVVTRPQVTRVTSQSSGASGLSRNSADIVTSVLNSLSPSIQAAVARYS